MMMNDSVFRVEDIDWQRLWQEKLERKSDRKKDWDKVAPTFHKSAKRDDYHKLLFKELDISCDDTVLDLGCGEGSITLPLAGMCKHVTGVDSSSKMLEILDGKCEKEGVSNIDTVNMDIEDLSFDELGEYDVVIASRSLNNVLNISNVLSEIDRIASKSVYITMFGPNNWRIEREFYEWIGKSYDDFPSHNYVFNILFNLGIFANVKNLDYGNPREYESISDAIESGKWRKDLLSDRELELLREYLESVMSFNHNSGLYSSVNDRSDWVLFWWDKL